MIACGDALGLAYINPQLVPLHFPPNSTTPHTSRPFLPGVYIQAGRADCVINHTFFIRGSSEDL